MFLKLLKRPARRAVLDAAKRAQEAAIATVKSCASFRHQRPAGVRSHEHSKSQSRLCRRVSRPHNGDRQQAVSSVAAKNHCKRQITTTDFDAGT